MGCKKISTAAVSLVLATCQWMATPTAATEWKNLVTTPKVMTIEGTVGARYWYGWGKAGKDLSNVAGNAEVSRLTYSDLQSHAFEAYGRVDVSRFWFVKGYAGGGALSRGWLHDEDFEPFITPYSSTNSDLKGSTFFYGSIDLGINVVQGADFRLGAFAGYHLLHQRFNAYGCAQDAGNPTVCVPTIPDSVNGISQDNMWHSIRLGLNGQMTFAQRWVLDLDAAYLPYVKLAGEDSHWLRIGTTAGDFSGPIPEDGKGWGYQLEGSLSYLITPTASIGAGVRYWHMEAKGNSHFEDHIVGGGGSPQPVTWKNDILGIFVQGTLKFGPY